MNNLLPLHDINFIWLCQLFPVCAGIFYTVHFFPSTEKGAPGNVPSLFAGSVTDFIKSDPIIVRPFVYLPNGALETAYVRTLRVRNDWLNGKWVSLDNSNRFIYDYVNWPSEVDNFFKCNIVYMYYNAAALSAELSDCTNIHTFYG